MKNIASDIHNCNVIKLSRINNRSGNLTYIENVADQPFKVKRLYYLYDVPSGAERGGHAHKVLYQLVVAAAGSFEVILDDGSYRKIVGLNRPDFGLLIIPGIWRELVNFSSGAVCLVLASEIYDEKDYLRDYSEFRKWKLSNQKPGNTPK